MSIRLRLLKVASAPKSTPVSEPGGKNRPTKLWAAITSCDNSLKYRPLVVLPELAKVIGLNHAIVLGQLDYWLQKSTYETDDGRRWIYNTLAEWQCCFPWWDISTIKRIFRDLRDQKLVLVDQFDRSRLRRENFYSIDYDEVTKVSARVVAASLKNQQQRETIKTRRRFRGGKQPLLGDIMRQGWGSI